MEKSKIIEKFKNNGFNDETIGLLLNAIEEFKSLEYTKYLSLDDMINRICNNLNENVIFDDKLFESRPYSVGMYNSDKNEIAIAERYRGHEQVRGIFFHELMHCITNFKNQSCTGFCKTYNPFYDDDIDYTIVEGYGLNEGVTKYLETQMYKVNGGKDLGGYPILRTSAENLLFVIGEEELLDCYFNYPDKLEDLLTEHGIDYNLIIASFDQIHSLEKDVIKIKNMSDEERLYAAIFGGGFNRKEQVYNKIGNPMSILNQNLINGIGEINTLDDFEKLVCLVSRLKEQKNGIDENQLFGYIVEKIEKLQFLGYDKTEINSILSRNGIQNEIRFQYEVQEIISGNKNELISRLYNLYEHDSEILDRILGCKSYYNAILKYLYNNKDFDDDTEVDLEDAIVIGNLLQHYPEIEFDDVSVISYYADEIGSIKIFDIYGGRKIVLSKDDKFQEYTDEASIISIINIDGNNKDIKIKYDEKEYEFYDAISGEKLEMDELYKIPSNISLEEEKLIKLIEICNARIKEYEDMGVPSIIIENTRKQLIEFIQKLDELRNKINLKKSIFPEKNIGDATIGISIDLKDSVALRIDRDIKEKEELKKGEE